MKGEYGNTISFAFTNNSMIYMNIETQHLGEW